MITAKDIMPMLKGNEYNFLKEDSHLGNNIILLTLGGSKAYGTNIDTPEHISDTDLRGIATNSKKEILLRQDFEQVIDTNTDTVIYSFNKIIKLLKENNPNTIELLGCEPEQYIHISPIGQELINHRKMFLSKIAISSFGGYANSQLRRLQNALARDSYTLSEKEAHILGSIGSSLYSLSERYRFFNFECEKTKDYLMGNKKNEQQINTLYKNIKSLNEKNPDIKLYIDDSEKSDLDSEIFCDVNFTKYPIRDFVGIFQEMNAIIRAYDKIGKRNNKKDDMHLNKHAMHLIRLYLMAFDILEKEEIITYRKHDLELLMSIRNGEFQNADGTYKSAFFDLVNEYEKRLEYDAQNTSLPDKPDYKQIDDFVYYVNEKIILNQEKQNNIQINYQR